MILLAELLSGESRVLEVLAPHGGLSDLSARSWENIGVERGPEIINGR